MTTALNIPIDAAAARLRAAGHTVERQGMYWRVSPPGGELAIASADEVRALALGLNQPTTTAPIDALTITEADALTRHEATIADGVKTFVAVGEALAIIRDDRLYRTTHASFNDYLIARWPEIGGRRQADRLIGAASVADDLRPIGLTLTSESQARPLAPLAPDERRAAMQSATAAAGGAPPTAKQVAQAVREIKPAPLPAPPDGWTIWQNDGETTVGLRHTSGYKISGDASEAATLVQGAAAASRWLRDLAAWRVIYDPTCPPELNAFTAISDDRDPIAAHDLPTLALRAWRATLYEDDLPDVPDEVIDAMYFAGYDWRPDEGAWVRGFETILGETPIAELRYLARLPETPESRDADGPWFWASKSAAHPTAHHWHLSRVPPGGYVSACGIPSATVPTTGAGASHCGVCAKHADRRETIPIPIPLPAPTTTTGRTCECGQPAIAQRNIGGISGWRCRACTTREEQEDLQAQLEEQYKGPSGWNAVAGFSYRIEWSDGSKGAYTYDDALSMLHSSAMQLRKHPPRPRSAAVAWLATMRTMLAQCPDSTSFRKSEMQTAVAHIDALLALLSGRDSDTDDVWATLGDLLLSDERVLLLACRGALDAVVAEPAIETDVYDALSHRIGEAQAQLIEIEATV